MRPKKQNWTSKILNQDYHFKLNYKENKRFKINDLFLNANNSIVLEIGHGKGHFLLNSAYLQPDINFLGIEKNQIIFAYALRNIAEFEKKHNHHFLNLKILNIDAFSLPNCFVKNFFDTIILNFPDPWFKKRHQKRRLTSWKFIFIYEQILKNNHYLILKTDQENLWNFSSLNFQERNWKVIEKLKVLNQKQSQFHLVPTNYQNKLNLKYYFYLKVQLNLKNEDLHQK